MFLASNNTVSFLLAGMVLLALACWIALAVFLFQRRKRRKLLADQLSCKLREEALDQALVNPHAPAGRSIPDPVQVQYNLEAERKGSGPLLRLTEHRLTPQNQSILMLKVKSTPQQMIQKVQAVTM